MGIVGFKLLVEKKEEKSFRSTSSLPLLIVLISVGP